jgi:hypothetical protein
LKTVQIEARLVDDLTFWNVYEQLYF